MKIYYLLTAINSRYCWYKIIVSAFIIFFISMVSIETVSARPPSGDGCPAVHGHNDLRDNKTVAGLACVVDQPSDLWSMRFQYTWRGGICNQSDNGQLKVRCPIVRDAVGNKDGIGCVQIHFRDEDHPPGSLLGNQVGREVECVLRAVTATGDFIDDGEIIRTNNFLDEIQLYLHNSSPGGYYVVSCNLPPRNTVTSGDFCLQSLHWSEFEPTDN